MRLALVPVMLAVALAVTGCASTGQALIAADKAVYRTLQVTTTAANAYCDAPFGNPDRAERCATFNRDLVPILETAKANNLAIQDGSAAEIPATIAAIVRLRDLVWELLPQGTLDMLKARFETLYGQLTSLRGAP